MDERVNVKALFLGPKAENYGYFKEMLGYLMDDHSEWRRNFHPDDAPVVSADEQAGPDYLSTLQKTREALIELAGNLQLSSIPWFSPRYLGHMNADTLIAANLGYMLTLLYNPNNCAYEGSPATTALEIEVGRQLAKLMGYDPERSWGHITSGGTVANYEGLWMARNLKSIPLALKTCMPAAAAGLDDWRLRNLPSAEILALADQARAGGRFEELRRHSVRGIGMRGAGLGKVLVPQSKHYSWAKAVDLLGIGQEHLISVPVRDNYRIDVAALKKIIDGLAAQRIPILAVVAVVGTTEEGAVDEIHEIVRLRDRYEDQGVCFYLHIDAAYGGYARSLFLDAEGRFLDYNEINRQHARQGVLHGDTDWLTLDVYEAFRSMPEADSITVDPHKLGYVPYAAGAIVARDRRIIDLISYFAAYVFERTDDNPMLLGSYILEGSKAGAVAAAVWMAHRVVPLNITGYGRIIGYSIEGAYRFYRSLLSSPPLVVAGRRFEVIPLSRPDINIVDYAFHEQGNGSLEEMNRLNLAIYEQCSYKAGPVYLSDFIMSKTALSREEYGDAPAAFIEKFGIAAGEWDRLESVYVLRSCILTPYLTSNTTYEEYWRNFMQAMERAIGKACGR
ncbi:MAG TPA: pyridoxal-dependent decarboxylase [Syntrophales bacterium]|nr:pyridoxal-dependent decarboxylase [Syntrophales bacterium]HOD99342.1 pyridoxal-dependent decarboxylase [Syntrophales bacterium]HOH74010.1 pyridoxal-dependent decarboxylase [Syntrophales bacterium]HPN08648.1 pyridoxal-dependent decarboxylase [Syntrophales bacterium]HQB13361.1 pyridoxal-dependent decarboxylase [Syntrophales bacterium]